MLSSSQQRQRKRGMTRSFICSLIKRTFSSKNVSNVSNCRFAFCLSSVSKLRASQSIATVSSSKVALRQFSTNQNSVRCSKLSCPRSNLFANYTIWSSFSSVMSHIAITVPKSSYALQRTRSNNCSSIMNKRCRNFSRHLLKSVFYSFFFVYKSFSL